MKDPLLPSSCSLWRPSGFEFQNMIGGVRLSQLWWKVCHQFLQKCEALVGECLQDGNAQKSRQKMLVIMLVGTLGVSRDLFVTPPCNEDMKQHKITMNLSTCGQRLRRSRGCWPGIWTGSCCCFVDRRPVWRGRCYGASIVKQIA